ncbi:MAG: hypothetical protein DRI90_14705 [Deltaproteobacteria bacterium]|nr:MAG: hypothetical protein DRI90_14705 [Deltaproteobacteria bacterium]
MTHLVDQLLAIAWPQGVPQRLDELIDRPLCDDLLEDFKMGLVFPLDDSDRPVRLALSCQGERNRWRQSVMARWPSPSLTGLFDSAPSDTRLMVDSDGSDQAVVYLDDLQRVDHDLQVPAGLELLAWTVALPAGTDGFLTRHREPPHPWVPTSLAPSLKGLLENGAEGIWAIRWHHDAPVAALWISESRWRRNPAMSRRIVAGLGTHPSYDAAQQCLADHGREGYPDAVELRRDGGIEVTLGVLEAGAEVKPGGEGPCRR